MRFFVYDRQRLVYSRFRWLRIKYILYFTIVQILIAGGLIYFTSNFYDTPKEKRLKEGVHFLSSQFHSLNKRIIESDLVLQQILEKDSMIYRSIFEIPEISKDKFRTYYDVDTVYDYAKIVKETSEKLSILENKLAKEAFLLGGILYEAFERKESLKHIPAIQPIDNKNLRRTASGWGMRIHPVYRIPRWHYGIDFTAPVGTPIYATGDGVIEHAIPASSRDSRGYGNLLIINHGYGYKSLYAHLHKFNVSRGDTVKRGQIIGYVGNTGVSTGPHLHYEVIHNGRKVNPVNYFFDDLSPEEYNRIIEISNSIKRSYD